MLLEDRTIRDEKEIESNLFREKRTQALKNAFAEAPQLALRFFKREQVVVNHRHMPKVSNYCIRCHSSMIQQFGYSNSFVH